MSIAYFPFHDNCEWSEFVYKSLFFKCIILKIMQD